MKRTIYAVYDIKAQDVIGGVLYIHSHDAVAIRMFTDAYAAEGTMINKHPEDFALIALGELTGDIALTAEYRVILTGETLKNQQLAQEKK